MPGGGDRISVTQLEAADVALETPHVGLWRDAWFRLRRNPAAIAGFVCLVAFVVVALLAPVIAPYGPLDQNLKLIEKGCCPGPSAQHWFGVDRLGRDEFSRIVFGARYSLLIGVVSVAVGLSVGVVLGSIAGYLGGVVDSVIMRLMDVMLSIPGLLLAIGVVAALGAGLWQVMVAVGVANIPIFARLLRGSVLAQRENDFVLAARSVGVRRRAILVSHILPNAISPVIVQGTLALATAIIDVAGLSFLGLGDQDPSRPEWGAMLTDANEYLQVAPWLAIVPGLAIVFSALGFNLIGDGLREALDPKLRGHVGAGFWRQSRWRRQREPEPEPEPLSEKVGPVV
jgi:peptide/nickel transport system permease protein